MKEYDHGNNFVNAYRKRMAPPLHAVLLAYRSSGSCQQPTCKMTKMFSLYAISQNSWKILYTPWLFNHNQYLFLCRKQNNLLNFVIKHLIHIQISVLNFFLNNLSEPTLWVFSSIRSMGHTSTRKSGQSISERS